MGGSIIEVGANVMLARPKTFCDFSVFAKAVDQLRLLRAKKSIMQHIVMRNADLI